MLPLLPPPHPGPLMGNVDEVILVTSVGENRRNGAEPALMVYKGHSSRRARRFDLGT